MQKIVVIDDEIRQCRSMKKIMERLFPEISVEIFTEPASAIDYIERESVQIVITDICMPEIDGLTLVQMLMESDRSKKVILLTGHAEFEYARKAVSAGAYDFLLKPMDPDKLKAVMEKCIREVQEELLSREERSRMHEQLDEAWPVYMESLMNHWLTGSLVGEEQEKLKEIFPENKRGFMILTRFYGFDKWREKSGSREVFQLKNRLGLCMRQQTGRSCHSFSFFCNSIPETMVTMVFSKMESQEYPAWARNTALSSVFSGEIAFGEENGIQMGVGMYVENLEEEKRKAYESAAEALEYAFYFSESNICIRQEIGDEFGRRISIDDVKEKNLHDMMKCGEEQAVWSCLDEILGSCIWGGYPAPKELTAEVGRLLNRAAAQFAYPVEFSCLPDGYGYLSYEGFREAVRVYLKEFLLEIKFRDEGKKYGFTRKFHEYIKEHYMENISLESVAKRFMLSSAYCSRLIKDVMGKNFTQILIEERMEAAKELLKQSDMHIYEIAERVGYSDVKYFNRVFKTSMGMTPQQFRRECTGGK